MSDVIELMPNVIMLHHNKPTKAKKEVAVKVVAKKVKITKEIQAKVDQYITKNREKNILEKELKGLRADIEPFMEDNNIESLVGDTVIGSLSRTASSRAEVTSRYTYYDPTVLAANLPMEVFQKCLVECVDKDIVEALVKLGVIPDEVAKEAEMKTEGYQLRVK